MKNSKTIKCPNCGTFNTNREYCENCDTLISHEKKLELKQEKVKQEAIEEYIEEQENPNLAERLKRHPFFLYRWVGWILFSAFWLVSAIGAGIAWFIAMVAAG